MKKMFIEVMKNIKCLNPSCNNIGFEDCDMRTEFDGVLIKCKNCDVKCELTKYGDPSAQSIVFEDYSVLLFKYGLGYEIFYKGGIYKNTLANFNRILKIIKLNNFR